MLLTIPIGPVIIEPVTDLLVNGRHGLHVTLPPLAAQVLGLDLEQLEDIKLHHGLLHLQRSLQDGGRLEHHQHLAAEYGGGVRVSGRLSCEAFQLWKNDSPSSWSASTWSAC